MTRFLHTADWQIGRLFSNLDPEHAPFLAEARTEAVKTLARLASEHQVDAVLVAGDVFEMQNVSDLTIRRLFNALEGFAGPWLMISGNHDAALAESVWMRAQRLGAVPANAHLLLSPEVHSFPELGFAVLPAPLRQRHTHEDLTQWFDDAETPAGLLRIGLAHGCVQGLLAEDIDSPNPIAPDRCEKARLDYLALGDWHGRRVVHARMAYSGTPEPDRFKSNDAGQALLVDLMPGSEPQLTPLRVCKYQWKTFTHELRVESDLESLLATLAQVESDEVINLEVTGALGLAARQCLQDAIAAAQARARCLQADLSELRLTPSDEDISLLRADGYLAEVIEQLRASLGGSDAAEVARAQDCLVILADVLQQQPQSEALGLKPSQVSAASQEVRA